MESLSICVWWFLQGSLPEEQVEQGKKLKASESGATRTILLLPSGEKTRPRLHKTVASRSHQVNHNPVSFSLSLRFSESSAGQHIRWHQLSLHPATAHPLRLRGQRPLAGPSVPAAGRGAAARTGPRQLSQCLACSLLD